MTVQPATLALTPEQAQALDIARALAASGIPVFVAATDPSKPTGWALPSGWQNTPPDPAVVDYWRPGMALAAVMGHGLDLVDIDPRNGGSLGPLGGQVPVGYATALTPSGGVHIFIRSIGVRSRDGILPGVDIKAGLGGQGHGFAFIAPTVAKSKVTGQPVAYAWQTPPDLTRLAAAADDTSGGALAQMVDQARAPKTDGQPTAEGFMAAGTAYAWPDPADVPPGEQDADLFKAAASLRAQGVRDEAALQVLYTRVDAYELGRTDEPWTQRHAEEKWQQICRRYEDGEQQRQAPPDPEQPAPNPGRYFQKQGGLQAATLAGDVLALGPLAQGVDDILWAYEAGVWRPARHVVRDRTARLLGELWRSSHANTAEGVVRAYVDTITCDPVSQYVNFTNGLLDWRTGELHQHAPEIPSTVQLAIDYDPDADCPAFDKFLLEVLPADMIDVAWELVGYLMYSGNPLHKAVMLTGHGRNGKGTFLRVLLALLGRRNVTNVSLHDLMNTRFTTASLFGKLANIAGDIDATYLENTATFKGITGGDAISAEHKGRDRFDFTPWAVPVFSANKVPASADTTVGYLSRWLVLPFPNDFTGREDRRLDGKLGTAAELRGIAARAIAALPALLERGDFADTESGRAAKDEFARRVDQVRTWLADCTDVADEHPWVARTELYESYKRWAARDGHKPVKASEFYDRIEGAGGVPAIVHGTRGFKRIRVVDNGWITVSGAAGAQISNRVSEGADKGADKGADTENRGGISTDDPKTATRVQVPEVQPAPTLISENAGLGAEGAETPHPPSPVRTYRGGRDLPAPSAPKPKSAERRAKTEAKRRDAIAEAAGPSIALPALVERGGRLTPVAVNRALSLLSTIRGAWTIDVETTGYPIGHRDYGLRTIQVGGSDTAVVFDATDPEQAAAVRRLLGGRGKLHAHSATADLAPLAVAGILDYETGWDRMHDTVIAAKLADPQSTGSDPGLKRLAPAVLGDRAVSPDADRARSKLFQAGKWLTEVELDTPVEKSGWAQVDSGCETMIRYAASDVLDDAAIAREIPWPDDQLLDRERTAQRMTARIAYAGVRIDREHVEAMLANHRPQRDQAAERVAAYGIDNAGSPKQIADRLTALGVQLPRTKPSKTHPDGQPSASKDVLLKVKRDYGGQPAELVDAVLTHRLHNQRVGTFLEPYWSLCEYGDGRARPTVYTLAADTGRMSCVRPNLQQVPREGGFRPCFTADPGMAWITADLSGVEIRVAAALSQDQALIRMLLDGADIHGLIARQVYGPDAGKADRYRVKRGVFGWLYGGGIDTLSAQIEASYEATQAMIDTLGAIAPQLVEWTRMVKSAVQAGNTQYPTYAGRVIYLDRDMPHKAPNYLVQGTARELLIDAFMRWRATRWGECVLLPVHDEIDVIVPEGDADGATAALVECMTGELYGVPIVAEPSAPSYAWQAAA